VLRATGNGAAAIAAGLVPAGLRRPAKDLPRAAGPVSYGGQTAYSMAMHIHSSFSEQTASMDSQLYQATLNGVDVLWWTDHDQRMDGTAYRDVVHFTSLTHEKPAPGQGQSPWKWQQQEHGPLGSASGGGIVTTPCSPNDPVYGGALSVTAVSTTGAQAKYGYYANSQPASWNYRDNLAGQSLLIDVMLEPGWSRGYLEIEIQTSYHEASAGRPAGFYTLLYQVVPSGSGGRVAQGNKGVVVVPVVADGQTWTTVTMTPQDDIAALWPDLDARDFALWELFLYAVSTGDTVSGYFDYLRFDRTLTGGELFAQQASMMTALAGEYPDVAQCQGLEVSWGLPHVNWFGASITVPSYDGVTLKTYPQWVETQGIPLIHQAGGLASYNHPFGTSFGKGVLPGAQQDALLAKVAGQLLPAQVWGADIIEVGYPERAGVDLAHHLALWDVMSRNAVFLTGNGTSDDHWGTDWAGLTWNWVTSAWAPSSGMPDLLTALAAGQIYCGSLAEFAPSSGACLNLEVDGECPMGSVSLSSLTSRQLAVTATGIPSGGQVEVLQGAVDYAGTGGLASNAQVVASYSDADMQAAGGQVTLAVDTSSESYARTVVADATGTVVAASNPVWMLQNTPPNGIPAPRQV
jgi:hypothetical protein